VLTRKPLPRAVLWVAFVLVITHSAWAQDADADRAKQALATAITQYRACDFRAAKQTLLTQVQADKLSASDRRTYDAYLGKVDEAIRRNAAAMSAYTDAQEALKANNLEAAKKGFETAAASEYLPADIREDAANQAAAVTEKMNVAAQPVQIPVEPVDAGDTDQPAETTDTSAAKTDDAPATKTDAQTEKMLAAMEARQARARRLVEDGKKALDNKQVEVAIRNFEAALELAPRMTEAQEWLQKARAIAAASEDVLSKYDRMRRIAKGEVDAQIAQSLRQSDELLVQADSEARFAAAESAARLAQDKLVANKRLFEASEYRQKLMQIDKQMQLIAMKREQWQQKTVAAQQKEIAEKEADRIRRESEMRTAKIESLRQRVRSLQADEKFKQAMIVLQEILALEPQDLWAEDMLTVTRQNYLMQQEGLTHLKRNHETQQAFLDLHKSEIPWYHLIRYPEDWKALSLRREPFGAEMFSESEADRKVRKGLEMSIKEAKLPDLELAEAIQWLRDVSGLNIMVKWSALEAVGITREHKVNVSLQDVTVERILRAILDDISSIGISVRYTVDEGVVTISTKDDLTKPVSRVYDIRDLIYRVPDFPGPRIDTSATAIGGNNEGAAATSLFPTEVGEAGANNESEQTKTEIIETIRTLIRETVDPLSWRPEGEIGSIQVLHGQLVITQTPENHAIIQKIISQLREARALQIAIEARFITVSTGFLQSIGIDLDFYFNLGSKLQSGTATITDPWTGSTISVDGTSKGHSTNKFTPIAVTQDHSYLSGISTGVAGDIGGAISTLGTSGMTIQGTFLDDLQVNFLIQATQASSTTRSLTAPRLTLFNGQRAYVTVATQRAYVSDLEPIVSDNAVAFNPTVAYVPTGSVLDVEATISADRRYVTLTVRPQVANLNGFSTYFTTVSTTDANGDPLTGTGLIQLPEVVVQDLQTTVSVPDGGTLLLGGQKLAGEVEREMGTPLLSKIPVINRAFTNRAMVRDEQTLLILIRPKILIQQEEEELAAP